MDGNNNKRKRYESGQLPGRPWDITGGDRVPRNKNVSKEEIKKSKPINLKEPSRPPE